MAVGLSRRLTQTIERELPNIRTLSDEQASFARAKERTGLDPIRFRPWLQAFADYAFDKRQFTEKEIQAQITAAQSFGADGWLLWNPRNVYSAEAIRSSRP